MKPGYLSTEVARHFCTTVRTETKGDRREEVGAHDSPFTLLGDIDHVFDLPFLPLIFHSLK